MKNVKYFTENQNVYIIYTASGGGVKTELFCMAVNKDAANQIAEALLNSSTPKTV